MKGADLFYYLVLAIVVLAIALCAVVYSKKIEKFGNFYDTEDKFVKSQAAYFGDAINRSLMTNNGLGNDMKKLNRALFNVDVMMQKNVFPENPPFSVDENPFLKLDERNKKECKPISSPKFMNANGPDAGIACGWWFQEADDKESEAVLGTVNGPLDENFSNTNFGGRWIWDKDEAQKLEDAKACRKIKSCATMDLQPNCGFCLDTSIGIPVSNGKVKYDKDVNLSCSKVILEPRLCPAPDTLLVPKVVFTDDGNTLRSGDLYNGEIIPFDTAKTPDICVLNPATGSISKECLLNLIRSLGYTDNGVIAKILMGDKDGYYTRIGNNYHMYQITKSILKNQGGVEITGGIVGDGRIRKDDALKIYKVILEYAKKYRPGLKTLQNASIWLVYGNEYDPCDYPLDKRGPFDTFCLERVALESGCQRDGYKFPNENLDDNLNKASWGSVIEYFKNLFASMRNKTDTVKQKQSTLDCLGITMATDLDTLCVAKGEKCRVLSEAELLKNPAILNSKQREAFLINKAKYAVSPIEKKLAEEMAIEAKNKTAKTLMLLRNINKRACPPGPPLGSWDFYLGHLDDRLGRFKSEKKGTVIVKNGIGATFEGRNSYIKVAGPITTKDIKSITMKIMVNNHRGGYPRLWEMTNVALGGSWCGDQIFGSLHQDIGNGIGFRSLKNCDGVSLWANPEQSTLKERKWYHIAWTIDDDYKGMSIFIDGVKRGRWSKTSESIAFKNRFFETLYICNSVEQFNKDISVSWFRLFDYTIDEVLCEKDMGNKWEIPPYK
jgi:hypothetical protein